MESYASNSDDNPFSTNKRVRDCSFVTEGDQVSRSGAAVDGFTYSAIFNTCQRADEAELAFEVLR